MKLDDLNPDNSAAGQIRNAAERIIANLKAENKNVVTLQQTRSNQQILASGDRNGDGVIPAVSVKDEKTASLVNDIMQTIGSVDDASGNRASPKSCLKNSLLKPTPISPGTIAVSCTTAKQLRLW